MPVSSRPLARLSSLAAATLALALAFAGVTATATATPALADGAGLPFSCTMPTFFAQAENAGVATLFKGSYTNTGGTNWAALGDSAGATLYNALAFNPNDSFLYATAYGTPATTGHLMRIDSAGTETDIGPSSPALGAPTATLWDTGVFDPAGNYYVASGNAGTTALHKVTGVAGAPAVAPVKTQITLSQSVTLADLAYLPNPADPTKGYLWGHSWSTTLNVFYRIDPATGTVLTIPSTAIPANQYGSVFAMGNGNLSFIATNARMYQVSIFGAETATPTFTQVNDVAAVTNARSDASNCIAAPADLSVATTVPAAVPVDSSATWTVVVTNNGPGAASGFVVKDTLPTGFTGVTATSPSAACVIASGVATCSGGPISVGGTAVITFTGTTPATPGSRATSATVTGYEADLTPANNSSASALVVGSNVLALVDDDRATAQATPIDIDVLANDTRTGGGVTSVSLADNGTTSIDIGPGTVRYTPDAGFSGDDAFTYTVTDGTGQTGTATVTVRVAPSAVADSGSTRSGTPITLDVVANDNGTGLALATATAPVGGTVQIVAGSAVFTPAADFSGSASFAYTATDQVGQTVFSTAAIAVAPDAVDDQVSTPVGVPVDIPVLTNDRGTTLSVTSVSNPVGGTVTRTGDVPRFTPAAGFTGTASFDYAISGTGGSDTASVDIVVAPRATDDSATTPADTDVLIDVLANDSGDTLSVESVTGTADGTVVITAGQTLYTPTPGFSGTDSFGYTAKDAAGQIVGAVVTVTVTPVALDDIRSTSVDVPVTVPVLGNDRGSGLEVGSVSGAANGSVSLVDGIVTFIPTSGFSGTASFDYGLTGDGGSDSATVTITVRPVAIADSVTTPVDTAVLIDVVDNDLGANLVAGGLTGASHGTVQLIAGRVRFTPEAGFSGVGGFDYVLSGDGGLSAAHVTVRITPTAADDSGTTTLDTPVILAVRGNDVGTTLAVRAVTPAASGVTSVVDGRILYTPNSGFSGSDAFTYTVADGSDQTATATVTVTVLPVASDDDAATVTGTPVAIDVLANDGGTGLELTTVEVPTGGTAAIVDGEVVFTPAAGFSGPVSFDYTTTDDTGSVASATVTVLVTPLAPDDVATTVAGSEVDIPVLGNDSGSGLSVTGVSTPAHGTAALRAGGIRYSPARGFSGLDRFTYDAVDSVGSTYTATVTVSIEPLAADDSATTVTGSRVTLDPVSKLVGTGLRITGIGTPIGGTATVNPDGTVTYVARPGFSGVERIAYTVTDHAGQEVSATLEIRVRPLVTADSGSVISGASVVMDLIGNDSGSRLRITGHTDPAHGRLDIAADGTARYDAAPGFVGIDSFTYTVTDDAGQEVTTTVQLVVLPLGLAATGSDPANLLLVAVMLLLGGITAILAQRRPRSRHAARAR